MSESASMEEGRGREGSGVRGERGSSGVRGSKERDSSGVRGSKERDKSGVRGSKERDNSGVRGSKSPTTHYEREESVEEEELDPRVQVCLSLSILFHCYSFHPTPFHQSSVPLSSQCNV